MLEADLRLLRAHDGWPCVSLLGPSDATEQARLVGEARRRLADAVPDVIADDLVARLDEATSRARTTRPAVGVFVGAHLTHTVEFPQSVRPRVVVDQTFATRDLVTTLVRHPRYLVLELDGDGARLWAGLGDRLEPMGTDAFPVAVPPPDTPNERRHRQEPSQRRDAHLERAVRAVDAALDAAIAADDPRPLYVVGDRSRAPRHVAASRHAARVAAVVTGRADGVADRLRDMVADHVAAWAAEARDDAIEEVGAAIGAHRFASGLAQVWTLAHEGRGELLVVDEQFHAPAVVDGDTGQLTVLDAGRPGGIDDAVDVVIEAVIERGGRVAVVPDSDTLAHWDRIALKLRH
jgi:hypothetical protein